MRKKIKNKLKAAIKSKTVWFSASIPVALSIFEAFQGSITQLIDGNTGIILSCIVSAVVSILRVYNTGDNNDNANY